MLNKKIVTVILFFAAFYVFAQDKDTVIVQNEEGTNDTILIGNDEWNNNSGDNWNDSDGSYEESDSSWDNESDDDYDTDSDYEWGRGSDNKWDHGWNKEWNFNFGGFNGRPAISLNYGLSQVNRYNFSSKFGDPNLVEGRIGYMTDKSKWDDIGRYGYKYFRFGNYSTQLSNKSFSASQRESSMWRFGFGWENGYSWQFGQSAIIPYHTYAIDWSRVEIKGLPDNVELIRGINNSEDEILTRFNKSFRFGTSYESGIKFRTIAGITLEGGYERSIIFERHLFWKWAGSSIIEMAAQGLMDNFIENIMDNSPYVTPIANFILKGALSYGIYELRQEKMNWPFNSAAPLSYDQFKFGVTFMF